MAVEHVIELVMYKTIYPEISLHLYFITESCQRLMMVLTCFEVKGSPLACTVYNTLEDLRSYLRASPSRPVVGRKRIAYSINSRLRKRERISSHFKLFLVFPLENWKDI